MAQPGITGWQAQILRGVGAPVTPQNVLFVNDWAKAEGGRAANNPFNTTQPASGASSYNSVGVRNYLSPQQGIGATIQTLKNGRYGGILSALHQGTSARSAASALAASPWGTGSLVEKMLGGGSPSSAAPAAPVFSGALSGPSPAAQPESNPLLGQLLAQTNQMVGLGSSPNLASLLAGPVHAALSPHEGSGATVGGKAGVGQGGLPPRKPRPGSVKFEGSTAGEKPRFLASLAEAVNEVGGTQVRVNSGYRSPAHNAAVGGVQGSNHTTGDALDGEVLINGRWIPLGVALKPVAQRYGLRSGAVPGFFNGRPDPVHVDDGMNQR